MKTTMKAQVFYEPFTMKLEEVPIPTPRADQVLIRVRACGICGSDNAYYRGRSPLETSTGKGPLVLGHELSGEVAAVGSIPAEAGLWAVGDRVTVNPVQYCGSCPRCLSGLPNLCEKGTGMGASVNGAFAEYTLSKYQNLWRLPDDLSFEVGSIAEPLACGTYGVMNMNVKVGDTAAVIGPGPIGSMMVRLIKSMGAGRVFLIGNRDYRLQAGKAFGADVLVNNEDKASPHYTPDVVQFVKAQTGGQMIDRVITATASPAAMTLALDISAKASTVVFFGLPGENDEVRVPALKSILGDKTIRFSWLAPSSWPTATRALFTKQLDPSPLITHTFPLADLVHALDFVNDRRDGVMKGVVIP